MSEREINTLMRKVHNLEESRTYEREYTDTMEMVSEAYTDYKEVLCYN